MKTPRAISSNASRETSEDVSEQERKVLFEKVSVLTCKGSIKITRFEAFLQAERKRSLNNDLVAIRNVEKLAAIIRSHLEKEKEIERNPSSFAAIKHNHERMVSIVTPFVALISFYQSQRLSQNYFVDGNPEQPAPIIRPYYIDDKNWAKARFRVFKTLRKKSSQDNKVGYGKPPQRFRFKNVSGNPLGRPKGPSLYRRMQKSLDAPVETRSKNGGKKFMSHGEVLFRNLLTSSMQGSPSSRRELMKRITELDKKNMLKDVSPKRRPRSSHLDEEQKKELFDRIALCASHVKCELTVHYNRKHGTTSDRTNSDLIDYEYEARQNEADGKAASSSDEAKGDQQKETGSYPPIPFARRAHNPVGERRDAPREDAAIIAKRNRPKPAK